MKALLLALSLIALLHCASSIDFRGWSFGYTSNGLKFETPNGLVSLTGYLRAIYEISGDGPSASQHSVGTNGPQKNTIARQTTGTWTPEQGDLNDLLPWLQGLSEKFVVAASIKLTGAGDESATIQLQGGINDGDEVALTIGENLPDKSQQVHLNGSAIKCDILGEWTSEALATPYPKLVFEIKIDYSVDVASAASRFFSGEGIPDVSVETLKGENGQTNGVTVHVDDAYFTFRVPAGVVFYDQNGNEVDIGDIDFVQGKFNAGTDGNGIIYIVTNWWSKFAVDPVLEYSSAASVTSWMSYFF